jgi:hypothetical protein
MWAAVPSYWVEWARGQNHLMVGSERGKCYDSTDFAFVLMVMNRYIT